MLDSNDLFISSTSPAFESRGSRTTGGRGGGRGCTGRQRCSEGAGSSWNGDGLSGRAKREERDSRGARESSRVRQFFSRFVFASRAAVLSNDHTVTRTSHEGL